MDRKRKEMEGCSLRNPRLGIAIASGAQEGSPLRNAVVPGLVRRYGAAGRGIIGNYIEKEGKEQGKIEKGGKRRRTNRRAAIRCW